ncbi:MAG: hypothetical protein FJ087_20660, partial [Deltaproteobacteria bacterium]|nr:hypothetical protein [Deltaproteobacteria bacterium]
GAPDDGPRNPAWDPDAPAGETDVGGADPAPEQADVPKSDEGVAPPDPGAPGTDADPADAHDAPGETPCLPSCEDNECGEDGCGDLCGWCEWGKICVANRCVQVCVPACEGKLCGEDGCGGECQPGCADNEFCGMDFTCVLKGCTPSCAGRACGSDGCGDTCGDCPADLFCTPEGACVGDTSCHDVTATGRCVGTELQWCDVSSGEGVLKKEICDPASGRLCGWDALAKKYACVVPERCEPQCEGRECGPDGCTGDCGACAEGLVCSSIGKCGEACGVVTDAGLCAGSDLVFCHKGILLTYDCAAAGKECKLDPVADRFDCL